MLDKGHQAFRKLFAKSGHSLRHGVNKLKKIVPRLCKEACLGVQYTEQLLCMMLTKNVFLMLKQVPSYLRIDTKLYLNQSSDHLKFVFSISSHNCAKFKSDLGSGYSYLHIHAHRSPVGSKLKVDT